MSSRFRQAPATFILAAAILAGFGLEIARGALRDPTILTRMGAISEYYVRGQGQYWRLLSAMFLHGSVLHLVLNLLALWQLGALFETMFGTRRFVFIYFLTGLLASVTSLFYAGGPSVGASGAIFGILGAFIFSIRRSPRFRHEKWARGIVQQLIFWIVANIAIGMTVPQIDLAAHLGGLVAGLLIGAMLPHPAPPPAPPSRAVIDVDQTFGPPPYQG
jgi:rhomboid protease GluP